MATAKPLARQDSQAIARPLKILVPLIKEELEQGDHAGLEHYRRAGDMLLEAKEQVAHGEWKSWLDRNFHLSAVTAGRYMRLVEAEKNRRRPFSTLSEVFEPQRETHQPSWQAPIREILTERINVEKLGQERQNKTTEEKLVRDLVLRAFDIGFKVLATQLHPDKKGGSPEAMARLNAARALVKRTF